MTSGGLDFARANLLKVLALPKFALSWLLAWFIPRDASRWVFGSGIGVGEGALAVALALQAQDPAARIAWLVSDEVEAEAAREQGFESVLRRGRRGYWATLRAGQIVVTHGLGDVNRFGVFGGRATHLIHGAPLKRLHLDSPVTTAFGGPAILRRLLQRMYLAGGDRIELYVAGSVTAAERLRSAYRVAPGRVRVLGDPRDDGLARQRADPQAAAAARREIRERLGLDPLVGVEEPLILYAPTWRDGDPDPAVPRPEEIAALHAMLHRSGARMLIRSHPLGAGDYAAAVGERVHLLGTDVVREITPVLGAFDAVVTDYSSIAIDYSLLGRPIVWFAPDLAHYSATRGLYEPLEVTAAGRVQQDWAATLERLAEVLAPGTIARRAAEADARALSARFHAHPEGGAAERVLAEIRRLGLPARERVADGSVFFESFYGRQVSCNPLALDREIARRFPDITRYWSVVSERIEVPEGAIPLLEGGSDWHAARRTARLLVVNDWLRRGFRRSPGQVVLQTWHGTMLKHLALGRPNVSFRTRLAIRRESRRWSLMLSQNPHSTAQFRSSYAFRGEILETGYPRDDRLANSLAGPERSPILVAAARRELGVPTDARVLAYVPTWRDAALGIVDELDVHRTAALLGDGWVVVARGHTRSSLHGGYGTALGPGSVVDASAHPDVNDVILAADVLVTDYSSVMFDAAVARVPMMFFVPDLPAYRDRERGFTFDFEATAPGPLLADPADVVRAAHELADAGEQARWRLAARDAEAAWRERYTPHDDGHAAERVVDALVERGALPAPAEGEAEVRPFGSDPRSSVRREPGP